MSALGQSERLRAVLAQARDEAVELSHEYIGTEHVLLALTTDRGGVVEQVFKTTGIDPVDVRDRIVSTVVRGRTVNVHANASLPLTSRTKASLELAEQEARALRHPYLGPEHALLGMLAEQKGIAAQILADSGLTLQRARDETTRILGVPRA